MPVFKYSSHSAWHYSYRWNLVAPLEG